MNHRLCHVSRFFFFFFLARARLAKWARRGGWLTRLERSRAVNESHLDEVLPLLLARADGLLDAAQLVEDGLGLVQFVVGLTGWHLTVDPKPGQKNGRFQLHTVTWIKSGIHMNYQKWDGSEKQLIFQGEEKKNIPFYKNELWSRKTETRLPRNQSKEGIKGKRTTEMGGPKSVAGLASCTRGKLCATYAKDASELATGSASY